MEISSTDKPFPLWALLTIYCKAEHECYINYMEGFKALVRELGPVYWELEENPPTYPQIAISYEVQEIAKYLNCSQDQIVHTLINKVYPNVK